MQTALFVNGVYETVLTEILEAQATRGGGESFLQPKSEDVIQMLKNNSPTPASPIRFYASTTENLSKICYTAEIINWEDKRKISQSRRETILQHLEKFQQKECELFLGKEVGKENAVNLITIRNLRLLETFLSTSNLKKKSDGLPLKPRKRSGGWSEVYDESLFAVAESETEEVNRRQLENKIADSKNLDDQTLRQRLTNAPKTPKRVQIISLGFRRNADVIVAVLKRANGICERCKRNAPFNRKSDGTPFLEVHHKITLAEGGEDTVENAIALCPNCHREAHYGCSGAL